MLTDDAQTALKRELFWTDFNVKHFVCAIWIVSDFKAASERL